MFKNKKMLLYSGIMALSSIVITMPIFILNSCSQSILDNNINNEVMKDNKVNSLSFSKSNGHERKLGYFPRTSNKNYYSTKLQEDSTFKYPAYNYDFKTLDENERILNVNKLLEERTNFVVDEKNQNNLQKYAKYSDPRFILNEIENNSLKKHPIVENFYLNNVIDETKSLTKEFYYNTSNVGPTTLGLYAPAGEIITVTLDEETYNLMKEYNWQELYFEVNNNYWDCKPANDKPGSIGKRYPYLYSSFKIDLKKIDPNTRTFKFGTPFGGGITMKIGSRLGDTSNVNVKTIKNIKYKIEGAVEQFHYSHGQTTKEDWNEQIKKLKNKEITAPILSFNSNYFSFQMQFYDQPEIKSLAENNSIDSLIYPEDIMNKWEDFMFLSTYGRRNDITGNFPKCDFKFAEEIWGGGAAWGGGNIFYCPPGWGVGMFFKGPERMKADSWGVLHEANHNYQVNEALFARRTHGETNQVNMVNLAAINDESRWRNPKNINEGKTLNDGGGSIYVNPYTIIEVVNDKYNKNISNGLDAVYRATEEYPIYAMLIHKLGIFNYLDYIRWDQVNHPNTMANWTGLEEIRALSEFFKMNFFEAFADYSKNWNEANDDKGNKQWPSSYNNASAEQKKIIDAIRKYPAFDFVGNFYSSGSYNFDYKNNTFIYNDDYSPAYEIPAGKDYVFEFDKFINSTNMNFKWNNLKIESQSKVGASIEIDSSNNKRIIYKPNISKLNEVDEFDISITPTSNQSGILYQPKYMWKIKVRQNAKGALVSYYDSFKEGISNNYNSLFSEWENVKDNPKYEWVSKGTFEKELLDTKKAQPGRYWFDFTAPKDGIYEFQGSWDDIMGLWINNEKINVKNQSSYQGGFTKIYEVSLKKGETINVNFVVINTGGNGGGGIKALMKKSETDDLVPINLFDYATIPNIENLNVSIEDILYDPKYQYVMRRLDYFKVDYSTEFYNESSISTNFGEIDSSDYEIIYDKSKGTLYSDNNNQNDFKLINDKLKDVKNRSYVEWVVNDAVKPSTISFEFEVTFKEAKSIRTIYMTNRRNHWKSYPEQLQIIGFESDNSEGKIIYDGNYGDVDVLYNIHNLNDGKYKKLKLKYSLDSNRTNILTIGALSFSTGTVENNTLGKSMNFGFSKINKQGSWSWKKNDWDENLSSIGGGYLYSNKTNNSLDFVLENTNGFRIIGQKTLQSGLFDVYIDGQLISANVDTKSTENIKELNQSLYEYWIPNAKTIKVKIVHKNNNPLYLNYVSMFGVKSKLK